MAYDYKERQPKKLKHAWMETASWKESYQRAQSRQAKQGKSWQKNKRAKELISIS